MIATTGGDLQHIHKRLKGLLGFKDFRVKGKLYLYGFSLSCPDVEVLRSVLLLPGLGLGY